MRFNKALMVGNRGYFRKITWQLGGPGVGAR